MGTAPPQLVQGSGSSVVPGPCASGRPLETVNAASPRPQSWAEKPEPAGPAVVPAWPQVRRDSCSASHSKHGFRSGSEVTDATPFPPTPYPSLAFTCGAASPYFIVSLVCSLHVKSAQSPWASNPSGVVHPSPATRPSQEVRGSRKALPRLCAPPSQA